MILEQPNDETNLELTSLAVNLATLPKPAEIMCLDNGLKFLIKRAVKTRNGGLLKLIVNISMHSQTKMFVLVGL